MKVGIFGGTGFIGRNLTTELLANGYQVSVVTRNSVESITKAENRVRMIRWSDESPLAFLSELEDADAIINLAGESIGNRRWTDAVKKEILNSRIKTTKAIVSAINSRAILPKALINASAVGYYGPHKDEEITEAEEAGEDFLAQVCREWEKEAYKVQPNLTRVATIRIGVVLGNEGALNRMAMPFRFYLGGPLGTGEQWLSWIHIKDLTRIISISTEYGKTINLPDIKRLQLKNDLPQGLKKVVGINLGTILKGNFTSKDGDLTVYIDTAHPPFIFLSTTTGLIIINDRTKTDTQSLYNQLETKIKQK
ncbi:TIGR01777 family oxidoreductase [Desulfosporosinus sp. PR]|uniref:TIGR01777 family oxidoreductase n=1 Tax=Candidatus Desulfosporosinus nitrosoreducens TaxID=3401928 RepID=UPI0027F95384|nr:TIGR01777 family oxidoreductase [Desulfosporosinus sp. PR]MDQ7096663.1 TIGR01777 family oxidoreductase [Desulfosporosinus sp. PR]